MRRFPSASASAASSPYTASRSDPARTKIGSRCNMAGDKLAGIAIRWDYLRKRCRLSMPGFIYNLLIKFKHSRPCKPQFSPYKCLPISYGAKTQLTPESDTSELLDDSRKHRIHKIVGSLFYYARAVDNKLLVALSAIASRQAKATDEKIASRYKSYSFVGFV
jgi:hypothetical protein